MKHGILKTEWKQSWGFDSFKKYFLEITTLIAPKTLNVQVSPSVKNFVFTPDLPIVPFWKSYASFQFAFYAKHKQIP